MGKLLDTTRKPKRHYWFTTEVRDARAEIRKLFRRAKIQIGKEGFEQAYTTYKQSNTKYRTLAKWQLWIEATNSVLLLRSRGFGFLGAGTPPRDLNHLKSSTRDTGQRLGSIWPANSGSMAFVVDGAMDRFDQIFKIKRFSALRHPVVSAKVSVGLSGSPVRCVRTSTSAPP